MRVDIKPVSVIREGALGADTSMATSAERILVEPALAEPALAEPSDDLGEARLAYLLSRSIRETHVMRLGVLSVGLGPSDRTGGRIHWLPRVGR